MNYLAVGVMGHVDHGKTSLVRALTGVETDRLKEERERGISIVLGFADLVLSEGRLAFIDVPGHERFVRTMISGATGVRAALLVVDANEGVRPQTREHCDIARILGVPRGIVAISKCDGANDTTIARTRAAVRELVEGSFLAGAPVVETSAVSGLGLDDLRAALSACVAAAEPIKDEGFAYLPVDRAFSMAGFGTVVTGTLHRGALSEGDEIQLYPGEQHAHVRQVESHGEPVARGLPGRRTAVNLRGVDRSDVDRGFILANPGSIAPSAILDVSVALLASAARPVRERDRVRLLFGTAEVLARLRLLDRDELAPGDTCVAQLQAESPVPFLARERFVLRTESPVVTIGGGTFLGGALRRRRRSAGAIAALELLAASDIAEILRTRVRETAPAVLRASDFARIHRFDLSDVIQAANRIGLTVRPDGCVTETAPVDLASAVPAQLPPEIRRIADGIETMFRGGGLEPPALTEIVGTDRERNRAYRHLVDEGVLVPTHTPLKPRTPANTIVFHRDAIERARSTLESSFGARGTFQTQDAKAALGVSRKFLIPLLEYLDGVRFTRRRGEQREFDRRAAPAE